MPKTVCHSNLGPGFLEGVTLRVFAGRGSTRTQRRLVGVAQGMVRVCDSLGWEHLTSVACRVDEFEPSSPSSPHAAQFAQLAAAFSGDRDAAIELVGEMVTDYLDENWDGQTPAPAENRWCTI